MSSGGRNKAVGVFQVINLECSGCAMMISKSLKRIDGIRDVGINYVTDKVYVSYDPKKVTPEQIKKAIEKAGYTATKSRRGMGM